MFGWVSRIKRRNVESTFTHTLLETKRFQTLVESKSKCLACDQSTLQIINFSRSPIGWEASVTCNNCNCSGVVNSEGFTFKQLNSKGKARNE